MTRGLFLLLFAVLVAGVAPTVPWFDGGELGAAAATLGIPHPTGFPLWTQLAHAAALVPVGDLAFRLNVVCAVLAVAAGVVAAVAAHRLAGGGSAGRLAGAVAALGLVLSRSAWLHGTSLEVYSLHALTAALLLWLSALLLSPGADRRWLPAAGLAAGLLLGGHGELRPLLLPVLALVLFRRRHDLDPGLLAGAAGACALGLCVHLLLPVRAAAGPAHDWAHPTTLGALLDHLSAARIRRAFADRMLDPLGPRAPGDLALYLRILWEDLAPLLPLALVGAVTSTWRPRSRWPAGVALLVLATDAAYSVLVNPMGLADRQNGLPGFTVLAVLAGCGTVRLPLPAWARAAVGTVAVCAVALPHLAGRLPGPDHTPRRYGTAALAQQGPHGLLLTTSDHLSALTMWLQRAEGARPDLLHLVRQHAWYSGHTGPLTAVLGRDAPVDRPADLARAEAARRPVHWEHGGDEDEEQDAELRRRLVPGVPTFSVTPGAAPALDARRAVTDAAEAVARILGVPPPEGPARTTAARHLEHVGVHVAMHGYLETARGAFLATLELDPRSASARINLGTVASLEGRLGEAARWTRRALELDPDRPTALVNLGRYLLATYDNEGAGEAFERAVALAPNSAPAWSGLAAVEANRGHRRRAVELLLRALELDPDLDEARENLARLRKKRR